MLEDLIEEEMVDTVLDLLYGDDDPFYDEDPIVYSIPKEAPQVDTDIKKIDPLVNLSGPVSPLNPILIYNAEDYKPTPEDIAKDIANDNANKALLAALE